MTRHAIVFLMALVMFSWVAQVHAQDYSPEEAVQKRKVERNARGEIIAKDPADIADAYALHDALDKIAVNMMKCGATQEEERQACDCRQLPLLKKFQKHLAAILERNPDWLKETVSFSARGRPTISLCFYGLQQQSERIDRLECRKKQEKTPKNSGSKADRMGFFSPVPRLHSNFAC